LSHQDQVDAARDDLNGADIHATEQLERELIGLQNRIAKCADTFQKARATSVKAFMGPLAENAYRKHQNYIDDIYQWTCRWTTSPLSDGQVPSYDDVAQTSVKTIPLGDISTEHPSPPPPSYGDLYPHKSTTEFQPLPTLSNTEAQEQLDFASETSDGMQLDHMDILKRVIRKLIEELWELLSLPSPSDSPIFNFNAAQRRYASTDLQHTHHPTYTTTTSRSARKTQLHAQLTAIFEIMREELLIIQIHSITATALTTPSVPFASAVPSLKHAALHRRTEFINAIYRSRSSSGISSLLVPLNGTDPSSAHLIPLLPLNDVVFPPCVTGFPEYVSDQWESYEAITKTRYVRSLWPNDMPEEMENVLSKPASWFIDKALRDCNGTKGEGRRLTEEALKVHNGESEDDGTPDAKAGPVVGAEQKPRAARMHAREVATRMRHVRAPVHEYYPAVARAELEVVLEDGWDYVVLPPGHDDEDDEDEEEVEVDDWHGARQGERQDAAEQPRDAAAYHVPGIYEEDPADGSGPSEEGCRVN
jgi:hypothetical protein